jgi:hypothetical protein
MTPSTTPIFRATITVKKSPIFISIRYGEILPGRRVHHDNIENIRIADMRGLILKNIAERMNADRLK